jgi:hypothetical protein
MEYRKTPNEREMLDLLRRGEVSFPPLTFRMLEGEPEVYENRFFDVMIEVSWREKVAMFAVECKAISTPKVFQNGLNVMKSLALPNGCQPMLFRPFLSNEQLQELEREGVSGIDLCGNGVVIVPGKFAVFRRGGKNRFPSSALIKNIYRKKSSMVGRVFLVRRTYNAVKAILDEINRRNILVDRWKSKPMSLSTVSKSLKTLEADLVIGRNKSIRLLQPDKLLEKLRENYTPPTIKEKVRLKVPQTGETVQGLVQRQSQLLGLPFVSTGLSSVRRYALMQRGDMVSIYCPRSEELLERFPRSQTDRFPNLELIETEDETAYFDARLDGNFWWASPVQVYLELMVGDKRDQEIGEQMELYILDSLEGVQQ